MKARFLVVVLIALTASHAGAQSSGSEWDSCGGLKQPVRVESCSAIIASGAQGEELVLAHHVRGLAYLDNGNPNEAIADFTEALDLHVADKHTTASLLADRGIAYLIKRQPDQALVDFTAAIALDPADPTRAKNMGDAYASKADYADALIYYDKSLKLHSGAITRSNRAYALLKLKRYREALADYTLALKHESTPGAQTLFGRGLAEQALGDATSAARDMAAAKKLNPNIAKAFE